MQEQGVEIKKNHTYSGVTRQEFLCKRFLAGRNRPASLHCVKGLHYARTRQRKRRRHKEIWRVIQEEPELEKQRFCGNARQPWVLHAASAHVVPPFPTPLEQFWTLSTQNGSESYGGGGYLYSTLRHHAKLNAVTPTPVTESNH